MLFNVFFTTHNNFIMTAPIRKSLLTIFNKKLYNTNNLPVHICEMNNNFIVCGCDKTGNEFGRFASWVIEDA